ncbi:histidine kinase [Pseudomonas sp. S35]|uniref:FecR family protein n=1 Tax=Pseudomonas sp. S35 TaxID=1573719 RepID=UPI00132E7C2A|nr:FecR domain-containing protein [Pseudomonas sp. S35]QHF47989.1 histidine kinase [Pseudomonas sp. S35]
MPTEDSANTRRDQALDWLMRVQQAPLDADLRGQVADWCAASEANAKAYRKAERVWQLTGQVAPVEHVPQPAAPTQRPAARTRRARRWVGAAVAACLVVALAPSLLLRWQADYRTGANETRDITLSDGSVVQLDSHSAIAVDIAGNHRDVRLLTGQAFFKVMPDTRKPFHVLTTTLRVTVTGTAFNVDASPDDPSVAVQQGAVNVDDAKARRTLASLVPGQRLSFRAGRAELGSFAPSQAASWRQGQLIADDLPISEVLEQLRRYTPAIIVLRDKQLGAQRVTGVYDLRKPQAALQAVVQPYGAKVRAYSPWLLVLSK